MAPKVLFVLSSCPSFPVDGQPHPSGWFLPELAHPYNTMVAAGVDVVIASPLGGSAPLDPSSVENYRSDAASMDFYNTQSSLWTNTTKLSSLSGKASDFAAIFYVGGHGPMFDLVDDATSHALVREFWEAGKVVSAVCHGPVALAKVKLADGGLLIGGSKVTGLSNAEEDKVGYAKDMPFLLQDLLEKNSGGKYECAPVFEEKVVVSKEGRLITGQNPASSVAIAEAILKAIKA